MSKNKRFSEKIILINGGTSGIGLATAAAFALNGAEKIYVTGRSPTKWAEGQNYLQTQLNSKQQQLIEFLSCDVRVERQVHQIIEDIYHRHRRLDVCFNNAGVQPGVVSGPDSGYIGQLQFESDVEKDGSIIYRLAPPQPQSDSFSTKPEYPSQTTPASLFTESEIATSCFGIFYCLKWQVEYIFKYQSKDLPVSIINTSSRNGVLPDAHRPLYAASKAFILALTKSVANQVAQKSVRENRQMIRVNAISPGPVDTPLEFGAYGIEPNDKTQYPSYVRAASTGVPMQRTAQPEEIAPTVIFLADPTTSGYITGTNICVDGGHTGSPLLNPAS